MICTDCKEKPATVHVTQIINGEKVELHLCFQCAARRGVQMWILPVPPNPFLKSPLPAVEPKPGEERACAQCGFPWRDFLATGFLGCAQCYASFSDLLSQVIEKNYGNVRHRGKIPARAATPLKIKREIVSLKAELEKTVQEENFERAAELRDQIRSLERQV